jgi:hypothetical protein
MFGFFWASLCWIVSKRFERETGVAEERQNAEWSNLRIYESTD